MGKVSPKKYSEINFDHPGRRDFLAIFNAYKKKQIDFATFDNDIAILCRDNFRDFFNNPEYDAVRNLDDTLSWYTPGEEEQRMFNFNSMEQVNEAFKEVLDVLNIK